MNGLRKLPKPFTSAANGLRKLPKPFTSAVNGLRILPKPFTSAVNGLRKLPETFASAAKGLGKSPKAFASAVNGRFSVVVQPSRLQMQAGRLHHKPPRKLDSPVKKAVFEDVYARRLPVRRLYPIGPVR